MLPKYWQVRIAYILRFSTAMALVLAFFLASATASLAIGGTSGGISGVVVNSSGQPVVNAIITLTSPSQSTVLTTDKNGAFQTVNLPVDTYSVSISSPGYESIIISGVTVVGDQTTTIRAQTLTKQLTTIGRVSSRSASSAVQPNQTVDQVTVSGARIQQAAGKTYSTNANQLVLSAPGATLTAGGAISIRGSTANDVGYQFEGVNLREPSQGAQSVNTLIGLNSIQVIGGAGDASQGNVGSGVVNYTVKRGTYPAFGSLDLEVGGPSYYHQGGFEYGFASPTGRFSNYTSFLAYNSGGYSASGAFGAVGNPQSDAASLGGFFNTSLQVNRDLVNNFVYRFGKDSEQSLQVLFRNRTLDTYGNNGGVGGAPCLGVTTPTCGGINYYLYDPGFYTGASAFYAAPSAAYLAAGGPLQNKYQELLATVGLTGSVPVNSNGVPITQAGQVGSNIFNFLSFGYTRPLGARGAVNLRQYTYDTRTNADNTIGYKLSSNTTPQFNSTGGHLSGVQGELTYAITDKNTISVNGKFENDHPYSNRVGPYYALLALGSGGQAGTLSTSDWLNPINTTQAISATNPCPVTGGCYLYNQGFTQGGASFWGASGVPRIPLGFIGYREADYQYYGFGIRDQVTLSEKLRLDFGVRQDGANYHQASNQYISSTMDPGNPQDDDPKLIGPQYKTPRYTEPRFSLAFQATPRDSLRFGYGRSATFPVAQGFGTPVTIYGAPSQLSQIAPLDSAANPGCGSGVNTNRFRTTGTFFAKCDNYGQQFYWGVEQIDAPDDGGTLTPFFNNYDATLQHQFKNGVGVRVTGFIKRGYNQPSFVLQAQGPIDPVTLIPSYTIYGGSSLGLTKTAGAELYLTLPDRREGLGGFLQATYINAFSNIPPGSNGEEGTSPVYSVTAVKLGNVYRVGYISPFTSRAGVSYKHNGFKVNPIISYDKGYPISQGNLTPFGADQNANITLNGSYTTIVSTNLKYATPYGFGTASGVNYSKAFNYVDPAYAGSYVSPNIGATRGVGTSSSPGGLLSPQRVGFDMSFEYTKSKATFGVYVANVFDNLYGPSTFSSGSEPVINDRYQVVSTGIAGPLTGTVSGAATTTSTTYQLGNRNYASFGSNGLTPYYLRPNGAPRSVKVYYQLAF